MWLLLLAHNAFRTWISFPANVTLLPSCSAAALSTGLYQHICCHVPIYYCPAEGITLPFKAVALVTEHGRTRLDVTVKVRCFCCCRCCCRWCRPVSPGFQAGLHHPKLLSC